MHRIPVEVIQFPRIYREPAGTWASRVRLHGVSMDDDEERLQTAGHDATDRGVRANVPEAPRGLGRPEPKVASEEKAVDGCDPWLPTRRDGRKIEHLDTGKLRHDGASVKARLRTPNRPQVRANPGVARIAPAPVHRTLW
jgi:hypothetical protein